MGKKVLKKNINDLPNYRKVMPWAIVVFMIIFPWIVGAKEIAAKLDVAGQSWDIVLYYKELIFIIFSAFAIAWVVGENIFPDNVVKNVPIRNLDKMTWILLGIVAVATVLSALLAVNTKAAIWGSASEGEGMWVILGYIGVFLVVYNNIYNERTVRIFQKGIIILAAVVVVFSIIEFLYKPFLMWAPVEGVIKAFLSSKNVELLLTDNNNRVVLGFYNSNYYGGFCCLLYPFVYEMWLGAKTKIEKFGMTILNIGIVFCIIVSKSSCALYILILEIVVLCICEFKKLINMKKEILALIILMLVSFGVINVLSDGIFWKLGKVGATNNDTYIEESDNKFVIEDIVIEEKKLTIVGQNSKFVIKRDNESFAFCNGKGEILDVSMTEEGWIIFGNEEYEMIQVYISGVQQEKDMALIEIELGYKDTIEFCSIGNKFYGIAANGQAIEDIKGETKGFESLYGYFTGRGYAWINTLPLLKEAILIGKGPGNFVYNFKQYDYVGLLKTHGTHKLIVDKPHNTFLQYSVNIGMIGTVAMFALFLVAIFNTLKNVKKVEDGVRGIYIASGVSIIFFVVYSMLNDSIITVMPYVWIILGVNKALQVNIDNTLAK